MVAKRSAQHQDNKPELSHVGAGRELTSLTHVFDVHNVDDLVVAF